MAPGYKEGAPSCKPGLGESRTATKQSIKGSDPVCGARRSLSLQCTAHGAIGLPRRYGVNIKSLNRILAAAIVGAVLFLGMPIAISGQHGQDKKEEKAQAQPAPQQHAQPQQQRAQQQPQQQRGRQQPQQERAQQQPQQQRAQPQPQQERAQQQPQQQRGRQQPQQARAQQQPQQQRSQPQPQQAHT